MGLETGTYVSDLNTSNPAAGDSVAQGDDHIRLLKTTIKNTFPNINGAVGATDEDLAALGDGYASVSAGTNVTRTAGYLRRGVDGGVCGTLNLSFTGTIAQFDVIATLPAGFRPVGTNTYAVGIHLDSALGGYTIIVATINSGGQVYFENIPVTMNNGDSVALNIAFASR